MKKQIGQLIIGATLAAFASSAYASSYSYDVYALNASYNYDYNTNTGTGTGLSTIGLAAGQAFTITVNPNDLWNAGDLPRWSNADGLITDLFATGSDESLQANGVLIGTNYGPANFPDLPLAPFGALVGSIGSNFFIVGTNYSGFAPASGTLRLWYWDDYTPDNTQFIKATIETSPVPEPATMLLLGIGISGFAFVGRRKK